MRRSRSGLALCCAVLSLALGCAGLKRGMALDAARRAHARADCRGVEQALRELESLGALESELTAEASFYRGVCFERFDRFADAAEHYRYVIERHPSAPVAARAAERVAGIPDGLTARVEPEPANARFAQNLLADDLGRPNPVRLFFTDFGPRETLRLCLLREPLVTQESVDRAIRAMRGALERYAIDLEVPWVRAWDPPRDALGSRMRELRSLPLEEDCDRLLVLSALDWGERTRRTFGALEAGAGIAGEVESDTFSRGYVFVRPMSWLHLPGFDASELVIHELHHLFRCDHDRVMDDCYRQIVRLKHAAAANRSAGRDFFPAITLDGTLLLERDAVSAVLAE